MPPCRHADSFSLCFHPILHLLYFCAAGFLLPVSQRAVCVSLPRSTGGSRGCLHSHGGLGLISAQELDPHAGLAVAMGHRVLINFKTTVRGQRAPLGGLRLPPSRSWFWLQGGVMLLFGPLASVAAMVGEWETASCSRERRPAQPGGRGR